MPDPPPELAGSAALPAARRSPPPFALGAKRLFSRAHDALYRRSRGKLLGVVPAPNKGRHPVLLLETTGSRSGKTRMTPLVFLADGHDVVVVASRRGPDGTPDWLRHLDADPSARVRLRDQVRLVRAVRPNPAERARLWPRLVAVFARWGELRKLAERDVPVLILRPVAPGAAATV